MNLIILGTFCKYNQIVSVCFSLSRIGEGNGNPLQCSCLGNPRDGGAWWAAVYGVAQSQTRLKWLSSSSSSSTYYILECIFKVNLMYVLQTYCTFFFSPVFYKVLSLIPFIHSSVYIYQYQPPNIYHLLFSPWCPYVCSLYLCLSLLWCRWHVTTTTKNYQFKICAN